MKLELSIFVLCSLTCLKEIGAIGSMGPLGHLIINSVQECSGADKPIGNDMILKVDLMHINHEGDKALNVIFKNKIAVNDSLDVVLDLKKFEYGSWKKIYTAKGKPCRDFNRYIKKLWGKLAGALEPKLDKLCPIPPGSYKIDKFQAVTQDLETRTIFYGKLLVKITLVNKTGKIIFCVLVESDSQVVW